MIHMTDKNESCKPISYASERGLKNAIHVAAMRGNNKGVNLYHQRLALYHTIPINAARHTGISPQTSMTKAMIVKVIIATRIRG